MKAAPEGSDLCAALRAFARWVDAPAVDAEVRAVDAVDAFCAEPSRERWSALEAAVLAVLPPEAGTGHAVLLRRGVNVLATAAYDARRWAVAGAPASQVAQRWSDAGRDLLALGVMLAGATGRRDPPRAARVAMEDAARGPRPATRFPEPGFARLLAQGLVLAQRRELAKLTPAALATAATAPGIEVTRAQVQRVEAGLQWQPTLLLALARALSLEPEDLEHRAGLAHDTAQSVASSVLGIEAGPRWFAELVAVCGEEAARAVVRVAAARAALDQPAAGAKQ